MDCVVSFEDLIDCNKNDKISIPEYLITQKLANPSEESFASKVFKIIHIYS